MLGLCITTSRPCFLRQGLNSQLCLLRVLSSHHNGELKTSPRELHPYLPGTAIESRPARTLLLALRASFNADDNL